MAKGLERLAAGGVIALVVVAAVVLQVKETLAPEVAEGCSESFARSAAQAIVQKNLRAPGSAKFGSDEATKLAECRYKFSGYVDSQNSFGALLRTSFSVTVERDPQGDAWQGSDLMLK